MFSLFKHSGNIHKCCTHTLSDANVSQVPDNRSINYKHTTENSSTKKEKKFIKLKIRHLTWTGVSDGEEREGTRQTWEICLHTHIYSLYTYITPYLNVYITPKLVFPKCDSTKKYTLGCIVSYFYIDIECWKFWFPSWLQNKKMEAQSTNCQKMVSEEIPMDAYWVRDLAWVNEMW